MKTSDIIGWVGFGAAIVVMIVILVAGFLNQ